MRKSIRFLYLSLRHRCGTAWETYRLRLKAARDSVFRRIPITPDRKDFNTPGSYCVRCHAAKALEWVRQALTEKLITLFGRGKNLLLMPLEAAAFINKGDVARRAHTFFAVVYFAV
jgi:hypothetical protein